MLTGMVMVRSLLSAGAVRRAPRRRMWTMPDARTETENHDDDRTPFQRFEDFARKIIAVPKREIDERDRAARQPGEK